MNWLFSQLGNVQDSALSAVEGLINQAISYDPVAQRAIAELSGKVLAIESSLPAMTFYVTHHEQGLGLHANYDAEPDTRLKGSAVAMIGMALSANGRSTFAGSGVEVRGDQELLGDMQAILSSLDIDWETALAQLVGDVPAHFISKSLRSTLAWGAMAKDRAADVATGFVHEEARFAPTADEFNLWCSDIRLLRADTDRLQAYMSQLQASLAEKAESNGQQS